MTNGLLTFGGAVDNLVLKLSVLQDALGAEHVPVLHAVELHLFLRVLHAVLDLAFSHLARRQCWVGRRGHGETSEDLIVNGEVVWVDLMTTFVVWALDHTMLGEFSYTLTAKGVSTGERGGLLIIVIVRLEANATFEDRCFHHDLRFLRLDDGKRRLLISK